MSNDKPTMSEKQFTYCINLGRIDDITTLIRELLECDKIDKDQVEDILANFKSIRRELDDAFDMLTEEDEGLAEETMGDDHEDEEADVNKGKPLNVDDAG